MSGKTRSQDIIHEARQVKNIVCNRKRVYDRPLVPSNDKSTVRDRRHKARKQLKALERDTGMSCITIFHFPNHSRSTISFKVYGNIGKKMKRSATFKLFLKQFHHAVEQFEMTRPEPVPIKEAQNCIVKSPVPSPTEEENQIISIEEEILNQVIQKLPTHSGDTLDDYDKEKFKEKKDKNKKGINYDSSSSEDDEMAVRSTFSMVNKNTVLRNQTIRKEQGLNESTCFTETPESTGGVPTPHLHQPIEEFIPIPTDEDIPKKDVDESTTVTESPESTGVEELPAIPMEENIPDKVIEKSPSHYSLNLDHLEKPNFCENRNHDTTGYGDSSMSVDDGFLPPNSSMTPPARKELNRDMLQRVISQTSVSDEESEELLTLLTPSPTPSPSAPFMLPDYGALSLLENNLSRTSKLTPPDKPGKEKKTSAGAGLKRVALQARRIDPVKKKPSAAGVGSKLVGLQAAIDPAKKTTSAGVGSERVRLQAPSVPAKKATSAGVASERVRLQAQIVSAKKATTAGVGSERVRLQAAIVPAKKTTSAGAGFKRIALQDGRIDLVKKKTSSDPDASTDGTTDTLNTASPLLKTCNRRIQLKNNETGSLSQWITVENVPENWTPDQVFKFYVEQKKSEHNKKCT